MASKRKPRYWSGARRSAIQQDIRIRRSFPQFKREGLGARTRWTGSFTTAHGRSYIVRVEYGEYGAPKVYLVDPAVDMGCPHVYSDGRLCLFWPSDPVNEPWQVDSWVSETILPWCAAWLHFYDIWLDTGLWIGPEKLHGELEDDC